MRMLDSLVFGSKKNENYTKGAHLNGGEHNVYGIRIVLKRRLFLRARKNTWIRLLRCTENRGLENQIRKTNSKKTKKKTKRKIEYVKEKWIKSNKITFVLTASQRG